jgi:hypothetical protein
MSAKEWLPTRLMIDFIAPKSSGVIQEKEVQADDRNRDADGENPF